MQSDYRLIMRLSYRVVISARNAERHAESARGELLSLGKEPSQPHRPPSFSFTRPVLGVASLARHFLTLLPPLVVAEWRRGLSALRYAPRRPGLRTSSATR
jgi:hypothetical protein